jgi:hypothetical protein
VTAEYSELSRASAARAVEAILRALRDLLPGSCASARTVKLRCRGEPCDVTNGCGPPEQVGNSSHTRSPASRRRLRSRRFDPDRAKLLVIFSLFVGFVSFCSNCPDRTSLVAASSASRKDQATRIPGCGMARIRALARPAQEAGSCFCPCTHSQSAGDIARASRRADYSRLSTDRCHTEYELFGVAVHN